MRPRDPRLTKRRPQDERLCARTGSTFCPKRVHAITLLELLVILAIIGILLVIVLPAVQAVREGSRRLECSNHLKQIGIALAQYAGAHGTFPPAYGLTEILASPRLLTVRQKFYGPHPHLLPYLEQHEVFTGLNFSASLFRIGELEYPVNSTACNQSIAVFLCPSDPHSIPSPPGDNNYRANMGQGPTWSGGLLRTSRDGAFSPFTCVRPADVSDGLSQTIAFSEKIKGDGDGKRFTPHGDFYFVALPVIEPTSHEFVDLCRSPGSTRPKHFSLGGSTWLIAGTEYTWYNHRLAPNSPIPDCGVPNSFPATGAFAARSTHPGGVNILLADGAVKFVGDAIEFATWRALGTRSSVETVGELKF